MKATTDWKDLIRDIPDFPKPGILFKDITPILADARAFNQVMDELEEAAKPLKIQKIVAPEARGFIFGAPLALRLGAGFVPVRKKKKLPYKTIAVTYDLEYGTDTVEMHEDAIQKGERVLILDDLLATGGTSLAIAKLVSKLGGAVSAFLFCLELTFLPGRKKLEPTKVITLHKI